MSIEAVDSSSEIPDDYSQETSTPSPSTLWNGRVVKVITEKDSKLELIQEFYRKALLAPRAASI